MVLVENGMQSVKLIKVVRVLRESLTSTIRIFTMGWDRVSETESGYQQVKKSSSHHQDTKSVNRFVLVI